MRTGTPVRKVNMDNHTPQVARAPLAARIILFPMLSILLFVMVIYVIFLPAPTYKTGQSINLT